jgi:hypothetical protein
MKEVYKNLEFVFDEENGTTICVMKYDNRDFMGTAVCAPEDMDYLSKKTGQEIAFNRASVEVLKYDKFCLTQELKGLKSLYYSIKHSKKYNPKSYEAIMLRHQMNMRENDIAQLKVDIKTTQQYIKNYINQKDKAYKIWRKLKKEQDNTN